MVKKLLSGFYILLVLAFIYVPIAFVMIYSFTTSKVMGTWNGFTLELYRDLFDPSNAKSLEIMSAFRNTIVLGLSSAAISTLLGTMAAIGIYNMKQKTAKVMTLANQIPILNAEIVTGVSLMMLFVLFGMKNGFVTLLLSHVAFCTPYVVLSVLPKLQQMNTSTYEAALDLGAPPWKAIFMVVIPAILPGVLTGFLLSFTLSIDDFVVTSFNNGTFETLSTFIYADAKKGGLTPTLRALSTLIFAFVLFLLVIVNLRSALSNKKQNGKTVTKGAKK